MPLVEQDVQKTLKQTSNVYKNTSEPLIVVFAHNRDKYFNTETNYSLKCIFCLNMCFISLLSVEMRDKVKNQ